MSDLVAIWLGIPLIPVVRSSGVRMVQKYICQKKNYLFKKNCKKQSRSWDCVTDTAGLDWSDYLSLQTESLSAPGGGDAFHPKPSSRMRPPLAFTCKSLCACKSQRFPSLQPSHGECCSSISRTFLCLWGKAFAPALFPRPAPFFFGP